MIKSLVAAAALTIGLAGYAIAQEAAPGAPAGAEPMAAKPPMHHHMHHHHHQMHHHVHHHHHHHHNMAAPAPAPEAPK